MTIYHVVYHYIPAIYSDCNIIRNEVIQVVKEKGT